METIDNKNISVSHVHLIECRYIGPTATRCSKVKLTSHRFGDSISVSFDSEFQDSNDQGLKLLRELGFTVLSTAESWTKDRQLECNWFMVKEFESLKDKKSGKIRLFVGDLPVIVTPKK